MRNGFGVMVFCGLAALVVLMQTARAQRAASVIAKPPEPVALVHASPEKLARFEVPLYDLTDPGEKQYDAAFASQLRALLVTRLAKEPKFLSRLTSGPTSRGRQVVVGERNYVYYGICQSHQCDTTSMELLYDPVKRRMVGKLLDACDPAWLGQPEKAEMALLELRHKANYPATGAACAGSAVGAAGATGAPDFYVLDLRPRGEAILHRGAKASTPAEDLPYVVLDSGSFGCCFRSGRQPATSRSAIKIDRDASPLASEEGEEVVQIAGYVSSALPASPSSGASTLAFGMKGMSGVTARGRNRYEVAFSRQRKPVFVRHCLGAEGVNFHLYHGIADKKPYASYYFYLGYDVTPDCRGAASE